MKIFTTLLILIITFSIIWYFVSTRNGEESAPPSSLGIIDPTMITERPPRHFSSRTGEFISAQSLIDNSSVIEVSPLVYKNTDNNNLYSIIYDEPSGNLTILLYTNNTKAARLAAEKYLVNLTRLTDEELCSINAKLITNEYENPAYAGQNLGFSFCSGSVQLP